MALSKDNHTQVSNEFIEEYMSQLNGSAVKIFIAISRKTKGWHKETDSISISQMQTLSGLSRKKIIEAIKELENKDLIKVDKSIGHTSTYTLNYTSVESTLVLKVHQTSVESTPDKPQTGVESTPTKEIVKETTTKEILITQTDAFRLTQKLYDSINKPTRWVKNPPDLNKWAIDIERLNRIDGVEYTLIETVIEYIARHDRWKWKDIIQSGSGFRKHFDTIEKRMPKSHTQTVNNMQDDVEYYEKMIKEMTK